MRGSGEEEVTRGSGGEEAGVWRGLSIPVSHQLVHISHRTLIQSWRRGEERMVVCSVVVEVWSARRGHVEPRSIVAVPRRWDGTEVRACGAEVEEKRTRPWVRCGFSKPGDGPIAVLRL